MRILHTSDWHLGRVFHQVSLLDDQEYALREFLRIVDDTRPDVVVIAGDIYDRALPPTDAIHLLDEIFAQLVGERRMPVLVIAGNHDSPERLGFGARLLAERNLCIAGPLRQDAQPVVLDDEHGPVEFFLLPYASPEAVRIHSGDEDLRSHQDALGWLCDAARRARSPGRRAVAVAHAFVTGAAQSDSERALVVGGSGEVSAEVFAGFAYTALGHLHHPQRVGDERIQYSGSLLPYSFSEAGQEESVRKSVSIVEIDAAGAVQTERITLPARRGMRILQGRFDDILRDAPAAGREDYLRIELEDREPILDAMTRLRAVYPNALELVRPSLGARTESSAPRISRGVSAVDLFRQFWKYRTDSPLSDAQERALEEACAQAARASSDEERDS